MYAKLLENVIDVLPWNSPTTWIFLKYFSQLCYIKIIIFLVFFIFENFKIFFVKTFL